jgi:hypothetical protein
MFRNPNHILVPHWNTRVHIRKKESWADRIPSFGSHTSRASLRRPFKTKHLRNRTLSNHFFVIKRNSFITQLESECHNVISEYFSIWKTFWTQWRIEDIDEYYQTASTIHILIQASRKINSSSKYRHLIHEHSKDDIVLLFKKLFLYLCFTL